MSPGIYFVVKGVYPLVFDSPVHLIAFLNWLGVICFAVAACLLYRLFRVHMPVRTALAGCLLFLFTPLVWESTTYFHPILPSLMFLLAAVLAAGRIGRSHRGALAFILATLFAAASFCLRTEIIFVAPAIFLLAVFSRRRFRNFGIAFFLVASALVAYFAVMRLITDVNDPRLYGVREYMRRITDFYKSAFSIGGVLRSGTWAILGMGAFTVFLAVVYAWRSAVGRAARVQAPGDRKLLAVAAVWILIPFSFWLMHPVPFLRHYLLASVGLVWITTYLALRDAKSVRLAVLTTVVIAGNLLLPEGAYRIYNKTHPAAPKTPHGSFFYFHAKQSEVISRYNRLQAMVLEGVTPQASSTSGSGLERFGESTGSYAEDAEHSASGPGRLQAEKIVLVDWQGYGYTLYALATSSSALAVLPGTTYGERVFVHPYSLGSTRIRVVHAKIADALAGDVVTALAAKSAAKVTIYVPEEAAYIDELRRIDGARLVVY